MVSFLQITHKKEANVIKNKYFYLKILFYEIKEMHFIWHFITLGTGYKTNSTQGHVDIYFFTEQG